MTSQPTVVKPPITSLAFMWVTFPLIGVVAGILVSQLPRWISRIPALPPSDNLDFLVHYSGTVATVILAILGAVAGALVVLASYDDLVTVRITANEVAVERAKKTEVITRQNVTGVFVDHKDLVLLGPGTRELLRIPADLPGDQLRDAFRAHRYPWSETDPFGDDFRRWVNGTAQLSEATSAIFRAREEALDRKDFDDAAELRAELAQRGIVVVDRSGKQHWRATRG